MSEVAGRSSNATQGKGLFSCIPKSVTWQLTISQLRSEKFESTQVGQSVPYCELFAGKSLYEEPLGNTDKAPGASGARAGGPSYLLRVPTPHVISGREGSPAPITVTQSGNGDPCAGWPQSRACQPLSAASSIG